MKRLNDLPIGSKMLLGGFLLALLLAIFLAVIGFGYRTASQSQSVADAVQNGAMRLHALSLGAQQILLGGQSDTRTSARHAHWPKQIVPSPISVNSTGPAKWTTVSNASSCRCGTNCARTLRAIVQHGVSDAERLPQLRALQQSDERAAAVLQGLFKHAYMTAELTNSNTVRVVVVISTIIATSILVLFYLLHRNIAGRLARMNAIVGRMETTGDLSIRLPVDSQDEIGHLAQACNDLAHATAETMARERQEKEDLDEMIELILGVTDSAAKGDLTQVLMEFHGNKSIDHLANGVRGMIDSLNRLISEVRESGFQVAQSSSEISASAVQQEATTSELAATSNQISASASEIAATSKELVITMDDVYEVMQAATGAASLGQNGIDSMDESIRNMVSAVDTISAKLETLNEKAGNINMVVSTITKVADQTNLLSLNAAIEAEKAGEYGKGFSVVATEIRRLADQTSVSTWDIEQMVKEIQSATSACVMAMEKVSGEIHKGAANVGQVSGQLTEIIDKVQVLLPEFESVKESIHAQSDGATQISDSIRQLNESVQETAESLRRSNTAIGRLRDAVQVLNNGVARFTIN